MLERKHTLLKGAVFTARKINEELDNIIDYLNGYSLSADYSSHNVVTDGSIVDAISDLDEAIGDQALSITFATNNVISNGSLKEAIEDIDLFLSSLGVANVWENSYSNNAFLHYHQPTESVKLSVTNGYIVFAKDKNVFLESSDVTLAVTGVTTNGFVDIYIEENTALTPVEAGTKRIKMVGKNASTIPYSTTPDAGQYIIGSCLVYNSQVRGLHSKEHQSHPMFSRVQFETFNFNLGATAAYNSSEYAIVPVFVESDILISSQIGVYSGTTGGTAWNFDLKVMRDSTVLDAAIRERVPLLGTSTDLGRTTRTYNFTDVGLTPGLYRYYWGGICNTTEDTTPLTTIERVYGNFMILPKTMSFDGKYS